MQAAEGVHRVVNTHMAEGVRLATVRRGVDPRRFALLGFGGAAMAALAVPVLNFLVIPCAVAGATAMWVEQLEGDTAASRADAVAGERRLPD